MPRPSGWGRRELAAEALASGHIDLGVKGLELLTGGGSEAEGAAVLERAMLARTDDLAIEAAKLLIARRGAVAVASLRPGGGPRAAPHPGRQLAGRRVRQGPGRPRRAPRGPLLALPGGPRGRRVRAGQQEGPRRLRVPGGDPGRRRPRRSQQQRVIQVMEALGDPRAVDAFLDRIENDPAGTALADELLKAVGPVPSPGGRPTGCSPSGRRTRSGARPSSTPW